MPGELREKYWKKYSTDDMKQAIKRVLTEGWTAYKASKEYNVPYMTLQDRLKITPSVEEMPEVKKGRPFCLTAQQESELLCENAGMWVRFDRN